MFYFLIALKKNSKLFQVKYKKHKKSVRNGQLKGLAGEKGKPAISPEHGIPPHLVNGTILKTALTNPSEVSTLFKNLMMHKIFLYSFTFFSFSHKSIFHSDFFSLFFFVQAIFFKG